MPKIVNDNDLYRAVIQVVSERGYAGATTRQMAAAAGVSEVTLFRKYSSKKQLVRQAIQAILEQSDFEVAARYTGDLHADLLRVVKAYQASVQKHGQFFATLLPETTRTPELIEILDTPFNIFMRIANLLERYQAQGALRGEHPLHTLAALLGPLMNTNMMRAARIEQTLPPMDLDLHVEMFIDGHKS